MTNSERFYAAHKMAKANRDFFASYRAAFSWALTEVWAMSKSNRSGNWYTITDWFCGKNSIEAYAFNKRQIVSETEKAFRARVAVKWGNGLSIIKDLWIPKSVCRAANDDIQDQLGAVAYDNDRIIASVENGEDCFEFSKSYCKDCARMFL